VNQERSRANNFYKTSGNFFQQASATTKEPFPNANNDLVPLNYKGLGYNLAYTFGGTKNIKHAHYDSPSKRVKLFREEVRNSRSIESPVKSKKLSKGTIKKYVEDLKSKIAEEHSRRIKLEKKLKAAA
jgi:Txe/YoeB family toxin of Txe-Axe toxin-antitoxin module